MASKEDELDFNPFYNTLQTKFSRVFEAAQEKCYLICVPTTESLEGVVIDLAFIETHLLKPSPYFKGQYMTTHMSSNSKTVNLEDNFFITGEGFQVETKVRILAHEHGYNQELKPYQIYIIERPFSEPVKNYRRNGSFSSASSIKNLLPLSHSFSEQRRFLLSFEEYKSCIPYLDSRIQLFLNNYLVLPGYMQDAATKVQDICTEVSQYLLSRNKSPHRTDNRLMEAIQIASECYIMEGIHEKLFPVVCAANQDGDRKLLDKIKLLSGVTSDQLGVRDEFCCPLPAAKVELAHINGLKTPLEKLVCLKSTLDLITEGINSSLMEKRLTPDSDMPCLSSDDLLPILVTVIVEAKSTHLTSNLFYIEHFHSSSSTVDNLSFSLVTFRAAVNYLVTTDFNHIIESKHTQQQEIKSDEKLELTSSSALSQEFDHLSLSKFDRKLHSITKMLEVSTAELGKLNKETSHQVHKSKDEVVPISKKQLPPDVIPLQDKSLRKNQLGEFLSALQSDSFSCSYGKQS